MSGLRTSPPSVWPALLRADDVAAILGCSVRSAQRKMRAGTLGKFIRLDGKLYLRRERLLDALKARETAPEPRGRR